jgi:hypothetical protein
VHHLGVPNAEALDLILQALFDIRADVRRIRDAVSEDEEEDDQAENP